MKAICLNNVLIPLDNVAYAYADHKCNTITVTFKRVADPGDKNLTIYYNTDSDKFYEDFDAFIEAFCD